MIQLYNYIALAISEISTFQSVDLENKCINAIRWQIHDFQFDAFLMFSYMRQYLRCFLIKYKDKSLTLKIKVSVKKYKYNGADLPEAIYRVGSTCTELICTERGLVPSDFSTEVYCDIIIIVYCVHLIVHTAQTEFSLTIFNRVH